VNGAFVTVTVCVPGTANCQAIDHVLVDTGSSGLRLLANDGRAGGELSLPLPSLEDVGKNAVAECYPFLDGFTWGEVQLAIPGRWEMAGSIAIQVIGEAAYPVPDQCLGLGNDEDTLEGPPGCWRTGFSGIGVFLQDCGPACATAWFANPGVLFRLQLERARRLRGDRGGCRSAGLESGGPVCHR